MATDEDARTHAIEACVQSETPDGAIPIELVTIAEKDRWLDEQDEAARAWLDAVDFTGEPGRYCLIPGAAGSAKVAVGYDPEHPLWACAAAATNVPPGRYALTNALPDDVTADLALGWALAQYEFTAYKSPKDRPPRVLALPASTAWDLQRHLLAGLAMTRDLINMPAGDMMPGELSATMHELAQAFGADFRETVGDALLSENFPAIHAVGRASTNVPRLLDLRWGRADAPKVTLVGKGVCFDSGGLDIKPASGMRLMKKDMGGAAHVIGLARALMGAEVDIRLRVLVPAVENAIAGNAYRPGDIVSTRAGLKVEIDNTDAEGRVILSDALSEAGSESPEILLDFATLTGAARIALGTELPAMFCNDDALAGSLIADGVRNEDPVWRMPLFAPYRELIDSKVGDIVNGTGQPHGGAITAALFLECFVPEDVPWAHFDIMAWNNRSRPGRPEGGEAMAIRGIFAMLRARYT